MKKKVKKLKDGLTPAHEPCPYLEQCGGLSERCKGGEEMTLPYSCGMARAFELMNVEDV